MAKLNEPGKITTVTLLSGRLIRTQPTPDESRLIVLTPESLLFFDSLTGELLEERESPKFDEGKFNDSPHISPDGRYILGSTSRSEFTIYDTVEEIEARFPLVGGIERMRVSKDGQWLAIVFRTPGESETPRNIQIWNIPKKRKAHTIHLDLGVQDIGWLKDSHHLLVSKEEGQLQVMELTSVFAQFYFDIGSTGISE
jgi:hypothetical protein